MQNLTLAEQERSAYIIGDTAKADLLASIIDLEEELTTALDAAEFTNCESNEELELLQEFFQECFKQLPGDYPFPSVFSDHDKHVIFEAIRNSE